MDWKPTTSITLDIHHSGLLRARTHGNADFSITGWMEGYRTSDVTWFLHSMDLARDLVKAINGVLKVHGCYDDAGEEV